MRSSLIAPTVLAAVLGFSLDARAADPNPDSPGPRPVQDDAEPEKLDAWPELEDKAAAKRQITRLRKAKTEEMGVDAAAKLEELGAGVAPLLLAAIGKERGEEASARLVAALEATTDLRCTRLLASAWTDKNEAVRLAALRRSAALVDPGLEPRAAGLVEALEERAAAGGKKAPSDEELFWASIAACASGAVEGLPRTLAIARDGWKEHRAVLRVAWTGVRGPAAERLLVDHLQKAERDPARVVALRAMAGAATADAKHAVGSYLDVEANNVRVAAINALRGMIDGDPPLENLSVFAAIDEAKKWKARL